MPSSPRDARSVDLYVALTFLAGAVAFTVAFYLEGLSNVPALVLVLACTAVAEANAIDLTKGGRVSLGFVGIVLAALEFGPPGAVLAATVLTFTGWLRYSRGDARKLAFNFGQHNASTFIGATLAWLLVPDPGSPLALLSLAVGVGVLQYGLASAAVAGVVSLSSGQPYRTTVQSFLWLLPYYTGLALVAGALGIAIAELGGIGGLFAVPLVLTRYSMKQVMDKTREYVKTLERSNADLTVANTRIRDMSKELDQAYTGTLESLVTALDVRDQETRGHSVRVATHSLDVAKLIGIKDPEELAMVYRGALMHDVGKIGVPDGVLLKPGRLTEDEWKVMRRHPALGYRILAAVPYLRPTAQIVLAHHERWDGDGYPRRLKAEGIPLGARIFAICDTYDAIISDRPYRKGKSPEEALQEILRCAGTQFDPKLMEAFEALFPSWSEEDHTKNPRPLFLPSWQQHDDDMTRLAAG
ncbi:MAG: HD-GYP domain-containing protein [Dehalococcoidia bacterium]|nr:HD domain-containing protein [Dehalococcoidia bacterium]